MKNKPREISIAAGANIIEGGSASFTVTASPVPYRDLDVSVNVTQNGDFAAPGQTGMVTVTVPPGGSATHSVATVDDGVHEDKGSVTATLNSGGGYAVASGSDAATVTVFDNDIPEISIAAGGDITEGGSASFTITASPVPYRDLDVSVNVTQAGDFAASGQTGTVTVTVPPGGSATHSVATVDDGVHEDKGSVTATLNSGGGYAVAIGAGAATVAVADNDDGAAAINPSTSSQSSELGDVFVDSLNDAMARAGGSGGAGGAMSSPMGMQGMWSQSSEMMQGSSQGSGQGTPSSTQQRRISKHFCNCQEEATLKNGKLIIPLHNLTSWPQTLTSSINKELNIRYYQYYRVDPVLPHDFFGTGWTAVFERDGVELAPESQVGTATSPFTNFTVNPPALPAGTGEWNLVITLGADATVSHKDLFRVYGDGELPVYNVVVYDDSVTPPDTLSIVYVIDDSGSMDGDYPEVRTALASGAGRNR